MRINFDQIEYTNSDLHEFEGKPFTGIAYELFPNGKLRCEVNLLNGKEDGEALDYHECGSEKSKTSYADGLKHGKEEFWFTNKVLQKENNYEFDILLSSREWNEDAQLIDEYTRKKDDPLFQIVLQKRANEIS